MGNICAIDEWLVRNMCNIHRDILIHDYWQFRFHISELQEIIQLTISFHDYMISFNILIYYIYLITHIVVLHL